MSPDRPRRPATAAGYTFLEIVIVLGILTSMALVTEKAMFATAKTQRYLAAVRKVTERGHVLAYEIRERVRSSRRIFFNDEVGEDYLDMLDLSSAPMVDWARLPTVDETGRLGPDEPGDPKTGNVLFFVGETDATPAISDPDTQSIRYIDTYHFVCVYPHETDRHVIVDADPKNALDLVVWQSTELPDFAQIMAISDEDERESVIDDLKTNHGLVYAWDPIGEAGSSFYVLDDLRDDSPSPRTSVSLDEDNGRSRGGRLVYANVQLARADIDEARRKPLFTTDLPNVWLPHGFEVKVIGSTGSRQVWYHLAVECQSGMGEVAVHGSTLVSYAKDL